jgi:hypothetical protein
MKLSTAGSGVSKDNLPVTFCDIPLVKWDKREILSSEKPKAELVETDAAGRGDLYRLSILSIRLKRRGREIHH